MSRSKPSTSVATLIGDVINSRGFHDRRQLHTTLVRTLSYPDELATDPPHLTVGDEFQGAFRTLGSALDAAFRIRLDLLPAVDVRFGIGWGRIEVLEDDGSIQDGPAWWAAREAIEWTATTQQRSGFRHVRTAVRIAGETTAQDAPVNAALLCRDHLIGCLDARSLDILGGLMRGNTQKVIADRLGVSAPAVSQRVTRDGLDVILSATKSLSAA